MTSTKPTLADAPGAACTGDSAPARLSAVVPLPAEVTPAPGVGLTLARETAIFSQAGSAEVRQAAELLAGEIRPATGFALPITEAPAGTDPPGISLGLTGPDPKIGTQGYRLEITTTSASMRAATVEGLRNGVQTLIQLLPPKIEARTVQPGPWTLPAGTIVDYPRYPYRGSMLDLARYWFPPAFVERYIDAIARYKANYLHLHLTDDQGWRIQIDSWPRLATHGGSRQTEGGPGGYLTKDDYRRIVEYAAARNITVIPEVDLPGHTTAALASYPELNPDGVAPELYTGYDVGFSSLTIGTPETNRFVDDVIRELAEMTPGPYIHIGGEETNTLEPAQYQDFMRYTESVVTRYGKQVMGWHEILTGTTPATSIGQYWYAWPSHPPAAEAAAAGARFVMSPANHAYLDAKYTESAPQYGQQWAGLVEVKDAYTWDPDTTIDGVSGDSVLGVESALFAQITPYEKAVEFMVFPRMPVIAEVGWTPKQRCNWDSLRVRLAEHGKRWELWDVDYYRSPQIPWAH